MFDNLIESDSHAGEIKRRGSFFIAALGIYALIFAALGVVSVWAYDARLDQQTLDAMSLITPVAQPDFVEEVRPPKQQSSAPKEATAPHVAIRTSTPPSNDPTLLTKGVSVVTKQPPPLASSVPFEIGTRNAEAVGATPETGVGGSDRSTAMEKIATGAPEPPPSPKKNPPAEKRPIIVSKGPVNGMAVSLPTPVYPQVALIAGVSGTVVVQVLIDEKGKVVSAKAVSGNPLLQSSAVRAAYQARFTPTTLGEIPVKVSGIINYNFQNR